MCTQRRMDLQRFLLQAHLSDGSHVVVVVVVAVVVGTVSREH